MLKMKSLKHETLWRKFLLAFILMSLVPILIIAYIIHYVLRPETNLEWTQVQWLIFWLVASCFVGFWIVRHIITTFLSITKNAQDVASGDLSTRITVDEKNEISELARSFNRITKQLEENIQELERSKKLLQGVLNKVGDAVASFQNIDKFLELIVFTTIETVDAQSGKLMLIDEETNELVTKISAGKISKSSADNIKVGEGIIGMVAKDGKSIIASIVVDDIRKPVVCVPLIYSGKIIGVLSLSERNEKGEFTEDDLVILNDLSSQISIALDNYRLSQDVEKSYVETMTALALAVDARDPYTRGHCKRVADYCVKVAKGFGLSEEEVKLMHDASILHDIGKIGVPDEILRKKTPLTASELKIIQEHPVIGEKILKPIRSLSNVCDFVMHHHERINGEGYPEKLTAKDISLPLNIMIVADAFDAMTSDRPYRKAMNFKEAKKELLVNGGITFDKVVVEKFVELV